MSTMIQLPARSRSALVPYVVAILLALSIGAAAGSLATRAVADRPHPGATPTGWDMQKLHAMAGREQAEAIRLNGSRR